MESGLKELHPTFDTLIVVTPGDFQRVTSQYNRLAELLPPGRILFVGSEQVGILLEEEKASGRLSALAAERFGFLNENEILPFDQVHAVVKDQMEPLLKGRELPRGITGWYYQQFLKLSYAKLCQNEYYMVWDGDTVPCRPFEMFNEEGQPYFDYKSEEHPEYFVTMGKLIPGLHKVIGPSFISEHMLFRCDLVRELTEKIASNSEIPGTAYWEKVIRCLTPELLQSNSFSEFETYGTYVALTHMMVYKLRNWHSFRYGATFFDIDTISARDFNWLGRDFYAISFEKNQSRQDHLKNLFDNPEYQNQLSAKQMLQVVQEEFQHDELKETWGDEEQIAKASRVDASEGETDKHAGEPGMDALSTDEWKTYCDLGESLQTRNPNQAYLCYEQAAFLCGEDENRVLLKKQMEELTTLGKVTVTPTAFIILSHNGLSFTQQCLSSIRRHCAPESYSIVVVDNASTDGSREWLRQYPYEIALLEEQENLGFSGGCNAGLKAADSKQDILYLNNDTRLCHNALFWLRMGLYENDHVGAVGSVSNYGRGSHVVTMNEGTNSPDAWEHYGEQINVPMEQPYEEKTMLSGFALLVKRSVINQIGGFDEAFNPGYFEDDDLCMRIREAGYRLNLCHNSFIYHAGSQSFRKLSDLDDLQYQHYQYFCEKWGMNNLLFKVLEQEEILLHKLKEKYKRDDTFTLLEAGCGVGNFLTQLQYEFPKAMIYGMESSIKAKEWKADTAVIQNEPLELLFDKMQPSIDILLICERPGEMIDKDWVCTTVQPYMRELGEIWT